VLAMQLAQNCSPKHSHNQRRTPTSTINCTTINNLLGTPRTTIYLKQSSLGL
jgi:hypothetical protein